MIRNGEAFILNMHIAPYEQGNVFNHEPNRTRKLLLHKKEIYKLEKKAMEKAMTIVPTKVYLKKGKLKVEIALGKGKKLFDKRETIAEVKRDAKRYYHDWFIEKVEYMKQNVLPKYKIDTN